MKQERLIQLLESMSLEEKINQLLQLYGAFYENDGALTGPLAEMGLTEEHLNGAGSMIGIMGANKVKAFQKKYMATQPHHIPALFMLDVINGFKTIFPIPLAQGCTWSPDLSKKCASVAAKEASVSGIHVTFSPMVDLVRDARWGRVMETTGEDTYLNSCFSKAMVEGYQGQHVSEKGKMASCVKHFAAYGAPTGGRDYNTVELSERTLRDDYLPGYQAGIDAGCELVMTAFNTVDRIPATGNKRLLRQILREDMGFEGVVISDWQSIEEMIGHGYARDKSEAAELAIKAGVDIDMVSNVYISQLKDLIACGKVDQHLIDEAVMRILQLKNKLGLFENPYKDADEEEEENVILCDDHRKLAREAASESFVLLKNDHMLPLKKEGQSIALIGPYVDSREIFGAWSFLGEAKDCISLKDGILSKMMNNKLIFEKGCDVLKPEEMPKGFLTLPTEMDNEESAQKNLEKAIHAAEESEMVVLALGEHRNQSGEATSRADIGVPEIQMNLFRKLHKVNNNIVVVLFNGRPLDLREITSKAKAVLEVWLPGTEGGHAIADVLFGDVNPSGKLSMSFPYSVGQVPVHYNEFSTGRPHVPGKDKDRFRSKYLDIPNKPLYPFGFGLSYTTFSYSDITLSKQVIGKKESLTASVTVKNTGQIMGKEVVQLYIQDLFGSVVRPVRELKGFQKIALEPNESKTITFVIKEDMLRFHGADMVYQSEPGAFNIYIGGDSTTVNEAGFELTDDAIGSID